MELKAVPKPIAHDINLARTERTNDASKWLPEDALYAAWEELQAARAAGAPVKALIIAWYEETSSEQGACDLRRRIYCETTNDATALATDLFFACNAPLR